MQNNLHPRRGITTRRRRCPSCGGMIDWSTSKKESRKADDRVHCRDDLQCAWVGFLYETIPLPRKGVPVKLKPDFHKLFLGTYKGGFDKVLSAQQALANFEIYLQNHPRGDPDQRGHQTLSRYTSVLAQLDMLREMINHMGLGEYEGDIMRQEIEFLFPRTTTRPRGKK